MTVRQLTADDAPAYRALMLDAYRLEPEAFTSTEGERLGLPTAWWVDRIAHARGLSVAFGAFEGSAISGAVALEFESRERTSHKASLIGMYVAAEARRSGLGRALVVAALDHARARGGTRLVQLTLTEGNVAAQRLYESLGFVAFGLEPLALHYADGYRKKLHLWCDLCPSPTKMP